jgi:hypothetical protein
MKEPAFWEDVIADLPVCVAFRENWRKILEEAREYLAISPDFLISYPAIEVDDLERPGEKTKVYSGNSWKVATAGIKTDDAMTSLGGPFIAKYVKKTVGIELSDIVSSVASVLPTIHKIAKTLEDDGHMFNGVFSVVSPGTVIAPHRGDSNLMRVHLGLVCDPLCKITVGPDKRTWKEGELLAFKDGGAYPHSVTHNGTHDRLILIFDLTLDYLRSVIDHPML